MGQYIQKFFQIIAGQGVADEDIVRSILVTGEIGSLTDLSSNKDLLPIISAQFHN